MSRLTNAQVGRYKPKMKKAAPQTSSSGNPKPKYSDFLNRNITCLIGCLDSFGLDRYYDVSSQNDIDQLVGACKTGGAMSVNWFYLTDEDMESDDLIDTN
jgi:hypothetical protein